MDVLGLLFLYYKKSNLQRCHSISHSMKKFHCFKNCQSYIIHHSNHHALIWFSQSFNFIAVSSCSSEVFSYQCSRYFSVNHLEPTGGEWKSLPGNNPWKHISLYKHDCYVDVFLFTVFCSVRGSFHARYETVKMVLHKLWKTSSVLKTERWTLHAECGIMSFMCFFVSFRYGSGGAVGSRSPTGQLQPGQLYFPGHATQHRQDCVCIQRGEGSNQIYPTRCPSQKKKKEPPSYFFFSHFHRQYILYFVSSLSDSSTLSGSICCSELIN